MTFVLLGTTTVVLDAGGDGLLLLMHAATLRTSGRRISKERVALWILWPFMTGYPL
jgi:hypothetical protein